MAATSSREATPNASLKQVLEELMRAEIEGALQNLFPPAAAASSGEAPPNALPVAVQVQQGTLNAPQVQSPQAPPQHQNGGELQIQAGLYQKLLDLFLTPQQQTLAHAKQFANQMARRLAENVCNRRWAQFFIVSRLMRMPFHGSVYDILLTFVPAYLLLNPMMTALGERMQSITFDWLKTKIESAISYINNMNSQENQHVPDIPIEFLNQHVPPIVLRNIKNIWSYKLIKFALFVVAACKSVQLWMHFYDWISLLILFVEYTMEYSDTDVPALYNNAVTFAYSPRLRNMISAATDRIGVPSSLTVLRRKCLYASARFRPAILSRWPAASWRRSAAAVPLLLIFLGILSMLLR